jgi:outer membrane receptor protein involved in Fe transport
MPGSPTPLDAAGNRLNNAPEWSGGGSAVYVHAAGGRGTVILRAAFEPKSRRWELAFFVRNTGNQEYSTSAGNVPLTAYVGRPGDPRHWGTQFTLRR